MSKTIHYTRDTHKYVEGDYPAGYTYHISSKTYYQKLEAYIDELVDFAAEIREHEPTWRVK